MPALESAMLPLGSRMPAFELPDTVSGDPVRSADFLGQPVLVMFICNHCPFVKLVADELAKIGRDYSNRVAIVAISSNDVETHPADAPEHMAAEAGVRGYTFPYCFDESQEVAREFSAVCTPDFFLYDEDHHLYYRGQLDNARPNSETPVTGADLRAALDNLLAGKPAPGNQKPSVGCSIKWKQGN